MISAQRLERRLEQAPDVVGEERIRYAISRWEGYTASTEVVQKALELTRDPLATADQLQRLLSTEPMISARLLRTANSALYAVSGRVRTISGAVVLLGQERLREILQRFLIVDLFKMAHGRTPHGEWLKGVAVAAGSAARELAEKMGAERPDEALFAALLHNIGESFLASRFPAEFRKCLQGGGGVALPGLIEAAFGVSAELAGAWLLETWRMPAPIIEATAHWRRPLDIEPRNCSRRFLALIHAAALLGEARQMRRLSTEAAGLLDPEVLDLLGVEAEEVARLYDSFETAEAVVRKLLAE